MNAAFRASDQVIRVLALVAAVGLVVMMLHICIDVVLRATLSRPIPATVEIVSRYYMIAITFLPLAWVERRNGMVSVEIVDAFLPKPVIRFSDVLVALLAAAIYALLAYTSWQLAMRNYTSGTYVMAMRVPVVVWPTYFILPLGFALASIVTLMRAIRLAASPDPLPETDGERP